MSLTREVRGIRWRFQSKAGPRREVLIQTARVRHAKIPRPSLYVPVVQTTIRHNASSEASIKSTTKSIGNPVCGGITEQEITEKVPSLVASALR